LSYRPARPFSLQPYAGVDFIPPVRVKEFGYGVKVRDLVECLERLTANAVVASVLGSIPASSDTVESEERRMKQC
jgi:hypothetical protein